MLWEEIGLDNITKTAQLVCHWISKMLLLSPVAVKTVAGVVYGLGQLYDSFCLSAASERLTSCEQSQVVPYSDCVQLVIMLDWYLR